MKVDTSLRIGGRRLGKALFLFSFVLILAIFTLGGTIIPSHAATGSSSGALNNVQILVQTTGNNISDYSLTVYNSSGYSVASATNLYPGFGMELPSGSYLFTVMASQQSNYCCIAYAATSGTSGMPVKQGFPPVEYGYLVQQISGPSTLNIRTSPVYNESTTTISAHVEYANGSAASGVWVGASVVGETYYYPMGSNLIMGSQTGTDGSVSLVVPSLPIELSAYTSVQINLPQNETTIQTTVAGQPVNVTVYWSPNYVELTGYALILPPSTSATITLQAQQPRYYGPIPYALSQGGVGAPGVQSITTATASNAQVTNGAGPSTPSNIPPFTFASTATETTTTTVESPGASTTGNLVIPLLSGAVVVAVVLSAIGIAFAARRK